MANKRIRKKRLSKKKREEERCPLCGGLLPEDPAERVYGVTGKSVCANCMKAANLVFSLHEKQEQQEPKDPLLIHTPRELKEALDKSIIGQEEAKQAISVALWKQQLRRVGEDIPRANLMLYGPTGCGKTALVERAAKLVGLPFLSFDATTLSETGYRGRDAADMVQDLAEKYKDNAGVNYGVIFVDEADKMAALKGNDHRAAYNKGTQHSLLKLIEGTQINTDLNTVNTENILFIFGGAFSGLATQTIKKQQKQRTIGFVGVEDDTEEAEEQGVTVEDFIRYGMEPELMGRIGRCVPLQALTAEQLKQILLESDLSVYRKYQEFFTVMGSSLDMDDETLDTFVQKALERGVGARGLNALVEEWVEPKLAELAEVLDLLRPAGSEDDFALL